MGTRTKNRQKQTAELCKQHLREKHTDELVKEYILEFQGIGKNQDITRWTEFTDTSWNKLEMLKRLDFTVNLQAFASVIATFIISCWAGGRSQTDRSLLEDS